MPGSPTGPFEGTLEATISDAGPTIFDLGAWSLRMVEITNAGLGLLRFRFAAADEASPDIVPADPTLSSSSPNFNGGQPITAGASVYRTVPNGFARLVMKADAGEAASLVVVSTADLNGE